MRNYTSVIHHICRKEVFKLAWRLVSIPSGPEVGTHEIVEWLRDFLLQEGLLADTQPVNGTKHLNLLLKIPGKYEEVRLLLNGHLDTVPSSPNAPAPQFRQGKLYGRGAADMKGAVAAMVMALVALHRAQIPLRYGVLFTGVAGEEIGGLGTKAFLEAGGHAEMAIVGEPTNLRLVTAHKGVEWIQIVVEGRSAHASCPQEGVNAISWAAKVVQALEEWAEGRKTDKRHPLLGPPTLNVGIVQGGVAPNVVPDRCVIQLDYRWLPSETGGELLTEIEDLITQVLKEDPRVRFNISRMKETLHCKPLEAPLNHPLVSIVRAVLADAGLPSEPQGVPYGTDAAWLAGFGIPTVVWGPGDIRQAHSENEYIELNQVWEATKLYADAIMRLCVTKTKLGGKGAEGASNGPSD